MVFSSIPAYLDPANWQQQPNHHHHHHQVGTSSANPQLPISPQSAPPPPSAAHQPHHVGIGSAGSIRPGSMSERARLANIPMPEGPLKCPRCESTNTKFCYFNNYSLSQPRHFCKTCRRYWTRGGALRNVPVGGGCRRNKRSKSTTSSANKSPISGDHQTTSTSTSSLSSHMSGQAAAAAAAANNLLLGGGFSNSQLPPLRFMSPLGQLTDDHYNTCSDHLGLNFSGISTPLVGTSEMMNFHIGTNSLLGGSLTGGGGVASLLSSGGGGGGGIEQWRLQQAHQQFPFLSGLDASPAAGLYQFQQGGGGVEQQAGGFMGGEASHQVRPKLSASSMLSQLASVKMEDNPPAAAAVELNLSRHLLGMNNGTSSDRHHQQWNNNNTAWTDLSSFSSSSTSNNPI